ncbi:MAG: hypothetical protein NTU97_03940 [Candidatus Magasanikbacteria bacterium]|nr:hypothetical protein [Candidatus Magasanikbacteria bacterium]
MHLELHDDEVGNTLCARVRRIDYDYQAEMWVRDTYNSPNAAKVIKWILFDEEGVRCVWERPLGSLAIPDITQRSSRFTGEWEKGPNEVVI